MSARIACIVEGQGEVDAVPLLLRRIAEKIGIRGNLKIWPPIRVRRNQVVREGELERAVELAARKIGGDGAVLIVLDSDDDCPARLGPRLLSRASAARPDIFVAVALAKREFESWFLAAAESLRGARGLQDDIEPPESPEEIRGAKEWLSDRMSRDKSYSPTVDQAGLAARMDLDAARRAPSFDKFFREAEKVIAASAGS